MSESMMKLCEMLEKEVDKIVKKGDITPTELENAKKVVEVLSEIKEMEGMEGMEGGYSGRMYPMYYRDGYSDRYYDGNRSYDRSYGDSFRGGGSYNDSYRGSRSNDGYSGHDPKEKMIQNLRMMMTSAQSDRERSAIADCIDRLAER